MKIFQPQEVTQLFPDKPTSTLWTAIIPAAGKGSRLGYDKPKILYPIAGRPILDWLIDLLDPYCAKLIFVLSPSGETHIAPLLKKRLPGRFEIAIQDPPRGMADAIYQAVPKLTTPYTLIIWGDQVAIRPDTIQNVMKLQQFNPEAKLTMPLVQREEPYVHYNLDSRNRFTRVLEKREGANMPAIGESDCGLFACNTARLQEIFQLEMQKGITYSQATHEWNFLPLLPQFDSGGESVCALRLTSLEETIGVNDTRDAARLEKYLKGVANWPKLKKN